MKITVETMVRAPLDAVWNAWTNPDDRQRMGWQAILDRFARYVEARPSA